MSRRGTELYARRLLDIEDSVTKLGISSRPIRGRLSDTQFHVLPSP